MATKECPHCGGTGWKRVDSEGVRRVVQCSCVTAKRTEQLLAQSRVPQRYERCTFESFEVRKDRVSGQPNRFLEIAKIYAQRFVQEYPAEFGLLFIGSTGVGKTHLAVAVLRELVLQKGVPCLFYDFRDLLKTIQDSYNPVSQSSELRVLQPVLDAEVLLLDELAAVNPSDWVKDTLAFIINSRYNAKKTTLITTTLPFGNGDAMDAARSGPGDMRLGSEKALGQYGITLRSRLYEMCKVVEMQADDYRKAIKQAGCRFDSEP